MSTNYLALLDWLPQAGKSVLTILFQLVSVLVVARLLGWVFKKIGQPAVVGEMAAGIMLGPSLLGQLWPGLSAAVFPPSSLGNLKFLSQVGLVLFMFTVGMDLDLGTIRSKAPKAVFISFASILLPFALGMGLAYLLYEAFAPAGVPLSSFSLFMGIAMSITAFPVLARIVRERGLHKTPLGTLVIACAAADDATAWCLLAIVTALAKASSLLGAASTIAMAAIYVLVMLKAVRPALARLNQWLAPTYLLTLILSAYAAEAIGIHALFGAFLAGAILPPDSRRAVVTGQARDVAIRILLPLFFVFTGLRTQIGLLNESVLWLVCAGIIGVAVAGKFLGSALAARYVGYHWADSFRIGALMNTRGLMELVVLNIGFDLGILSPQIFAMMVIMALATTCMTGPVLNLINRFSAE